MNKVNIFLDLDDTLLDFSHDFVKFCNERMGKDYFKLATSPTKYGSKEVFGMTQSVMDGFIELYANSGKLLLQPKKPDAIETLLLLTTLFKQSSVTLLTKRPPQQVVHTIMRMKEYFYPWRLDYQLYFTNTQYTKKWKLVNALRGDDYGIFIDDCPEYINDVVENCPRTITMWMNGLNFPQTVAEPHYEVNSWKAVYNVINACEGNINKLFRNSNHPGIQGSILEC